MPPIYNAKCASCQYETSTCLGLLQALVTKYGEIISLPHPAERSTLREHGYSFGKAGILGRYARGVNKVCLKCGRVTESFKLCFPISFTASFPITILILLGFQFFYLGSRYDKLPLVWWIIFVPVTVVAAFLLAMPLSPFVALLFTPVIRLIYHKRFKQLIVNSCKFCGSTNLSHVTDYPSNILCPKCGVKALSYYMAGMA